MIGTRIETRFRIRFWIEIGVGSRILIEIRIGIGDLNSIKIGNGTKIIIWIGIGYRRSSRIRIIVLFCFGSKRWGIKKGKEFPQHREIMLFKKSI